jgi:signal peptidase I
MPIKERLKRFWEFLKEDSWQSWLVSLVLIIVIIKFIFFPVMSAITGTALPLVVVESCSMYHESNFDSWWSQNAAWYESKNISKVDFEQFTMHNGLNKGDILLVTRAKQPKEGDIIIYNANANHPLIHRVISLEPLQTKGDHNTAQLVPGNNKFNLDETNISSSQLVGKASLKVIPLLGWVKLIWFEPSKPANERGFCR